MADVGLNQLEATFKDGCTSLRQSVLMKQRAATSPGPIYEVAPTLGRQVLSTYRTAPLVGFTKGGSTNQGRPIENVAVKEVPGPKYSLDCITYGKQVQSRMRTACIPSFGSSNRPPLLIPTVSPGPHTAYFVTRPDERGPSPSIIGPTWRNKKQSSADDNPGPGAYNLPPASGKQVLSTKPSLPLCSFGGSGIKRDLAKSKGGMEPGPGAYNPLTKSANIRAITFGSGPQRPTPNSKYDIKPAPNKYLLPGAMGHQLPSTKHSSPSFSFGAR